MSSSNSIEKIAEEAEGPGLTGAGAPKKVRKRAPGGGRKVSAETIFKKAMAQYREKLPEVTESLIAKALGEPQTIICKHCRKEFQVNILGTGDKDCLIHIDNRIQGKPVAKTEVDLLARTELSPSQAIRLLQQLHEFERQYQALDLEVIEGEVKELPCPLSPQDIVALRQETEGKPQDIEGAHNTDYGTSYEFGEAELIRKGSTPTW